MTSPVQYVVCGFVQDFSIPDVGNVGVRLDSIPNLARYRFVIQPLFGVVTESVAAIGQADMPSALAESGAVDTGWEAFFTTPDSTFDAWFTSRGMSVPTLHATGTFALPVVYNPPSGSTGLRVYGFAYFGGFDVVPINLAFSIADPSALIGETPMLTHGYLLDASGVLWHPEWLPSSGWASNEVSGLSLSDVVSRVCVRGGLAASDFDVSALSALTVLGYPIARQTTGADALLPLLSAYFAFGSEQDAKLVFDLYGANVSTTIDAADLIEGNDANHNAIKWTKRNQATEYPRRMVAGYMDPAQNYTIVNVAAERRASGVTAIGDQSFAIPVVMAANDAAQAVDKALKVAYATLEGTAEYSVPFAQSACYLTLTAGDPVFFSGKRYVLDDVIVSNGYLKLTTRYDRQGAYTSDVQAIPGNAPSVPPSPYSGPTTLIPMNLPALRPQDSVGIYVAAGSSIGSADWRGCDVQISYDGMETWQAATQINSEANIGQFAAAEPTGGEPLTVDLFAGDLISATTAQLAANANVFAIVGANGAAEIAQFATAVESLTTPGEYALTGVSRALAGTPKHAVTTAMRFAQMDAAYFIPIDPAFAGRTLYLRGVGFGEVAEGATIEPIVFTAIVATPGVARIAEDGTARIAEDGINLRFTER